MNDPTNWNVADVGSFEFASPEEAKKAEAVMNRAMRESFENGKNVAFEEAAVTCENLANDWKPWCERDYKSDDYAARTCAEAIRTLKRSS